MIPMTGPLPPAASAFLRRKIRGFIVVRAHVYSNANTRALTSCHHSVPMVPRSALRREKPA